MKEIVDDDDDSEMLPVKDLFVHYRWSTAAESAVDSSVREGLRKDFLHGRSL